MFRNTTFTQQLEKMHVVTKVKEACGKNELKLREKNSRTQITVGHDYYLSA